VYAYKLRKKLRRTDFYFHNSSIPFVVMLLLQNATKSLRKFIINIFNVINCYTQNGQITLTSMTFYTIYNSRQNLG